MRPQDHCMRLTNRLKQVGLSDSAVFHWQGEGYYIARREVTSPYGAYGVGTEYVANHMTLAQAEAFVGGMCAAIRKVPTF